LFPTNSLWEESAPTDEISSLSETFCKGISAEKALIPFKAGLLGEEGC
jgi:hypothetical protein